MNYKNLTVYHLQKIYFRLTQTQNSAVKKKENYPEPQTLEELRLKAPLFQNF